MTRPHIAAAVRRAVAKRARNRCEYCLLPAQWASISHHIDHVIPLKHGGATVAENLAYACFECNIAKGSDIATFDPDSGQMVRLFNPRTDEWTVHFRVAKGHLLGVNAIGRSTAHLLQFNTPARIRQRMLLIAAQVYLL